MVFMFMVLVILGLFGGLVYMKVIDIDKLMGREKKAVEFELEVDEDVEPGAVEKVVADELDVSPDNVQVQAV